MIRRDAPVRILHVVGGMNRGGAETWLLHVLRNIDRDRFKMDFLVHSTEPNAYDADIAECGSRTIPCLDYRKPWVYHRNLKRILAEKGPYDVVHSHLYLFNGIVLRAAAQMGVPQRVAHMYPHADSEQARPFRSLYQNIMSRWISRYATSFLTDSEASMQSLHSLCDCSDRHQEVVYPGYDFSAFQRRIDRDSVRRKLGLPLDLPVVVYVGRFMPNKNHAQMIRVADLVNRDGVRAHFALAGSHGELLESIRQQAGAREYTSLLLGLPDVSELILASDLFFFPSVEEGFGIVAIEAAAAGLPIVATDLPALHESCPPGHRRFMFSMNDDEAAATSILTILNDQKLRTALSDEALAWAPRFFVQTSVDQLSRLYSGVDQRVGSGV